MATSPDTTGSATPVDLRGIDTRHRDGESVLERISIAVAETAAGVTGVHHLGGDVARSLDRAGRAVLGKSTTAGVSVADIDGRMIIDLDIVVEYPNKVTDVANEARTQTARAASALTDLPVTVNVTVTDVFGPGDRDRVAEADEAITGAVERTKAAASDAAARTKETAGRVSEATKKAAADASERSKDVAAQVREKTADAVEDIREGTAKAVDAARTGAARAQDAGRDGAARAADAIDDGVARAREAAADATEKLDRELAKRDTADDAAVPAGTTAAAPDHGDVNITVVVEEGASESVSSDDDDVEIVAKKDEPKR